MSQKSLRKINFSYVHSSTIMYGIILGGNLSYTNSTFEKQKRITWIVMNAGCRDYCCPLFIKLIILPLYSQNTLSLSTFVVKNIDAFTSNCAIHSMNTRQGFDFHPPTINLTKAIKEIKIFNNIPLNIKQLSRDTNKFKLALKKFLLAGSFCCCNE
jgi:hypothetical protein